MSRPYVIRRVKRIALKKCKRCAGKFLGPECANCAMGPHIPVVAHPDPDESTTPFLLPYSGYPVDRHAKPSYWRAGFTGDSAGPAIAYAVIGLNAGRPFWRSRAGTAWEMSPDSDEVTVMRRGGRRASERAHRSRRTA